MEEFQLDTKIVSGAGALEVLGEQEAKRVFLVTDPFGQRYPGVPGVRLGDF